MDKLSDLEKLVGNEHFRDEHPRAADAEYEEKKKKKGDRDFVVHLEDPETP